jgi:hypothetical protein
MLQQHAYRIGQREAALPAASVMEPVTGTLLGLTLFGERIAARHSDQSGRPLDEWRPRSAIRTSDQFTRATSRPAPIAKTNSPTSGPLSAVPS